MKLGRRRVRSIVGLGALLALTLSFSEAVWASTCLPGMRMGAAPESVEHTPTEVDDGGDPHSGDNERPCPFTSPLAAQACAGVSSMPAQSTEPAAPEAEIASVGFTVTALHGLLREGALFRPPRA